MTAARHFSCEVTMQAAHARAVDACRAGGMAFVPSSAPRGRLVWVPLEAADAFANAGPASGPYACVNGGTGERPTPGVPADGERIEPRQGTVLPIYRPVWRLELGDDASALVDGVDGDPWDLSFPASRSGAAWEGAALALLLVFGGAFGVLLASTFGTVAATFAVGSPFRVMGVLLGAFLIPYARVELVRFVFSWSPRVFDDVSRRLRTGRGGFAPTEQIGLLRAHAAVFGLVALTWTLELALGSAQGYPPHPGLRAVIVVSSSLFAAVLWRGSRVTARRARRATDPRAIPGNARGESSVLAAVTLRAVRWGIVALAAWELLAFGASLLGGIAQRPVELPLWRNNVVGLAVIGAIVRSQLGGRARLVVAVTLISGFVAKLYLGALGAVGFELVAAGVALKTSRSPWREALRGAAMVAAAGACGRALGALLGGFLTAGAAVAIGEAIGEQALVTLVVVRVTGRDAAALPHSPPPRRPLADVARSLLSALLRVVRLVGIAATAFAFLGAPWAVPRIAEEMSAPVERSWFPPPTVDWTSPDHLVQARLPATPAQEAARAIDPSSGLSFTAKVWTTRRGDVDVGVAAIFDDDDGRATTAARALRAMVMRRYGIANASTAEQLVHHGTGAAHRVRWVAEPVAASAFAVWVASPVSAPARLAPGELDLFLSVRVLDDEGRRVPLVPRRLYLRAAREALSGGRSRR